MNIQRSSWLSRTTSAFRTWFLDLDADSQAIFLIIAAFVLMWTVICGFVLTT